jgi:phage/plasmid primase-like uncharacterized protein
MIDPLEEEKLKKPISIISNEANIDRITSLVNKKVESMKNITPNPITTTTKLVMKVTSLDRSATTSKGQYQQLLYFSRLDKEENKKEMHKHLEFDGKTNDSNIKTNLYDHNDNIISTKEDIEKVANDWATFKHRKGKEAISRHIILSIGKQQTTEERARILQMTSNFLRDKFYGHQYCYTPHYDTQNDHIHIVVRKRSDFGKNLHLNKQNIRQIKQDYNQNLLQIGIIRDISQEHKFTPNNSWYQKQLDKGTTDDRNMFYYKSQIFKEIDSLIQKNNNNDNTQLKEIKRTIFNTINKDDIIKIIDNNKEILPTLQDRKLKYSYVKTQKEFTPKKKYINFNDIKIDNTEIINKFSTAIRNKTNIDHSTLDISITKAINEPNKKHRFGDKQDLEICWYGDAGYIKSYKTAEYYKWGINNAKLEMVKEGVKIEEIKKTQYHMSSEDFSNKIPTNNDKHPIKYLQKDNEISQNQEKAKQELLETKEKATQTAKMIYNDSKEITEHQYIKNKQLNKPNSNIKQRTYKNEKQLIIPLTNTKGDLQTIQIINEKGDKRFLKNGTKRGNFYSFKPIDKTKPTIITEGFATGQTIYDTLDKLEQDKYNIVSCIDSSNIMPVVEALKQENKNAKFIICADNDLKTEITTGRNIGVEKAMQVQEKYKEDIKVIIPNITKLEAINNKLSDFNDIATHKGKDTLKKELESSLKGLVKNERKVVLGVKVK